MLPKIQTATPSYTNLFVNEYQMNFDGCSKGNPGISGAGAVIYNFDKEIWGQGTYIGDKHTNNFAEYCGLILGLQQAALLSIKILHVQGDSLLVINQMKGLYKCRSDKILDLYNQAKELEGKFEKVTYEHIDRKYNKRADFLSNEGLLVL
jgi:ribonuclease HI